MPATPSPAEAALAPPATPVAHGRGAHNDAAGELAGSDRLLDALMRLAAHHFGVAAACVLPGDAAQGVEWLGAGVDSRLRDALAELTFTNDRDSREGMAEPLIVNDLGSDPAWQACLSRASALPFRFVAAWPLTASHGEALGSLCLLDPEPRELSAAQRTSLDDFARMIAALVAPSGETLSSGSDLRAELASLRERERLLALAIAGSGTGVWDRNVVTGEIRYSKGWKAMLGYADDEVTNRIEDSYLRLHPEDLAYVQATMKAHFEGNTDQYEVEHRIRCKDGGYKWICSRGKVTARDGDGRALRMVGTSTDVTSMREMAERLRESVNLITNLTNEVPGLVFQCRRAPDGHTSFPYASAGIGEIYELTPEEVVFDAAGIDALIHPDDIDAYRASFAESAATLAPWHLEYRVRLPLQGLRWRQGDARPQRRADGATVWHGFITDVTERKRIEAELQEFAMTDGLTRLANRRHFMSRLDAQLALLRRSGGPECALMMCDLDHFKAINDRFGHAVGDDALRHFAEILRKHLRSGDVAGRIGGEEFAILLGGADVDGACGVARRIQDCIAEAPLVAQAGTVALTVSIGVTPLRIDDGSAEATLSRSDVALYRAKKGGRNRIECA
ncbi:sensor domain-containing diguanylate cyclase [Paraburkholderia bannensis]|uniref:sensor domain-containing diguanylate cyclase n=1 Tax=Paraburkholderia bannensis TaxID=765414 RepID=UPI002AB6609F|nr:diguanylate cyclase [Paraburkholderia bannensis]